MYHNIPIFINYQNQDKLFNTPKELVWSSRFVEPHTEHKMNGNCNALQLYLWISGQEQSSITLYNRLLDVNQHSLLQETGSAQNTNNLLLK